MTTSLSIRIVGAREHNLQNISVDIPKRSLVVFTGVSGSGKSSLVFDTLYSEAQRQLIETFSSFARSRLPKISRPEVDEVENISTTITVDQRKLGSNPRSTVGTITEIYTYLRLLFSRCGEPLLGNSTLFGFNNPDGACPACKGLGTRLAMDLDALIDRDKSLSEGAIQHRHFKPGMASYRVLVASDYFDMDKPLKEWSQTTLDKLLYTKKERVKKPRRGAVYNVWFEGIVETIQRRGLRHEDDQSTVTGHGLQFYKAERCPVCHGSRINERARKVRVNSKTIPELVEMELTEFRGWLNTIKGPLPDPMVRRMSEVAQNLIDIGVGYLNLNRGVGTLSGGESQRVKMARQLGCDLVDLTYIFDEPSVGLHQRDIAQLVSTLKRIREKGNTVLVVEHDPAIIREADWLIDVGPGAGRQGGRVVFTGTYGELLKSATLTGKLLTKRSTHRNLRRERKSWMEIRNASVHNLKNISIKLPTGVFVCVTGVAGSGKSSLILDVFAKTHPGAIVVDQSPVGRSSRSNPATYVGVFDLIRNEFGQATGKHASYFSFNSHGACPKCKGTGQLKVEMHFLEPVTVTCDECEGRRYRPEVLRLRYKGKAIHDVLRMTIGEAIEFFESPETRRRLTLLQDVGLDYLELGQTVSSLSGGEAQRIKLAKELHKKGNIYILDEPTTGLHLADIAKLLAVINQLVDAGNTVIVIEHNMEIVKNADWIIDMGPEGGSRGGEIIAEGAPEEISKIERSYTGQYLANELKA